MKYLIIFAALLSLGAGASLAAADGVQFALSIHQQDSAGPVLLFADTATVVEGISASGFFLSFSLEIEVTEADSARTEFLVHAVTLGPPVKTYARSFMVEYGLPARIEEIVGKGDSRFSLTLTPLAYEEADTAQCPFGHREEETFKLQPSAYIDFHHVPNSFADFYMPAFKGVVDHHYREFKDVFKFSLPGKLNVFLAPCPVPSVLWDDRYGQVTDPTRSTAFAVAANGLNTVDPFLANHTALLRSWGYAPPLLSEGAANYTAFVMYDMQAMAEAGEVPPLDSLLDTYDYLAASPLVADRASASFVQYLINAHGLGTFRTLYMSADDLNLRGRLAAVYGKSVEELDAEWRTYVDTFTVRFPDLVEEADKAEAMFRYDRLRDYAQALLDISPGKIDSAFSYSRLKQAEFSLGNYYAAVDAAEAQLQLDQDDVLNWMTLAAFQMMVGMYPEARKNLQNGQAKDPSDQTIMFNRASVHLYMGDTASAESLLVEIISKPEVRSPQGEARVVLGELLMKRDSEAEQDLARTYFSEAMQIFQQQLSANQTLTSAYLWFGAAALGMGDTDAARTSLETALFLETRPFYHGLINLWLGKAADVLGDHEAAQEYYGRVISGSAAAYTQEEARGYLDKPYSMK